MRTELAPGPRITPAVVAEPLTLHMPAWMRQAACRGQDPTLFYPNPGDKHTAAKAKSICKQCPVQTDCLELAFKHHDHWGIWGGTAQKERELLVTRLRRASL